MDGILVQHHNPGPTTITDGGHWRLVGYRREAAIKDLDHTFLEKPNAVLQILGIYPLKGYVNGHS